MLIFFALCFDAIAVPLQMTQQGRVLDSSGTPYEGAHNFHFKLFDDPTAGTLLWEELIIVQVNNGYYAAVLGSNTSLNPLDEQVLSLHPLYLSLEIDSGAPLDRQLLSSAPYAQMAGVSESVDGGLVNASEISIGNVPVVDSSGNWVGQPITTSWSSITGIPAGFSDGVDDVLTEASVEQMITNGNIDLAAGSTIGGVPFFTPSDDQDSLALFSCTEGQVLKYDSVIGDWFCDNDSDALNELNCSDGAVAQYDQGLGVWSCVSPAQALASMNCSLGQVMYFNGTDWICQETTALFDQDGDGIQTWDDCDDLDPSSYSKTEDMDCDGFLSDVDCDNADPSSTTTAEDADCDSILTAQDCDDNDPASTAIAADADCDGFVAAQDCNDSDNTIYPGATEICGDGTDHDCHFADEACFQAVTFTNCGQEGHYGPSQSQCSSEYLGTDLEGAVSVSSGIQTWTVPSDGDYRITAYGAMGGRGKTSGTTSYSSGTPGNGAKMSAVFTLSAGEELQILVGQIGGEQQNSNQLGGGGGGGTFVTDSSNTPLVVAGGGGGSGRYAGEAGNHGVVTTSGTSGNGGNPGSGGTGGNGGGVENCSYAGNSGAGFYGNGNSPCGGPYAYAYVNGGAGSNSSQCWADGNFGGFGGGGGTGPHGGGGAGGYSGGGGGGDINCSGNGGGGGGGSYTTGSDQDNADGVNSDHGKVTIELAN